MKVSNTSERLHSIMNKRNLRQVDILNLIRPFAEKNDVRFEKNDLSQYVSGKVAPSQEKLTVLSQALGVSETWLMGYDSRADELIDRLPNLHPIQWIRKIPILGTISCGDPIFADENIDGYIGIDTKYMRGDFALRCKGDSMIDAEIYDGDIVLMKKTNDVENGTIAAVVIEDEATLKKVYKQEKTVVLQPCNNNYAPIVIDLADEDQVYIIGECVGVYHSLNQ